jgi:presenilin-like A22 family membrane protease
VIPEHPRLLLKRLSAVKPGEGFFFLGTGDIALPAIFVASALRQGPVPAFGAVVGSVVGLLFTDLFFAIGRKRPMPALPPIAVGTMLGFFAGMLIQKYV